MNSKSALLAAASLFAVVCVPGTSSATSLPLDLAAKVFGARPSASAVDLSPKGDRIVYLEAASGGGNVVRLLDLKTKQTTDIVALAGKPDKFSGCEFAAESWIVCYYRADISYGTSIIGSSRTIAIDLATKQSHDLGVESQIGDAATIKQNDGYVISYAKDGPPAVVMARYYVRRREQANVMNSNGPPVSLGIDRIDLSTMKATRIMAPDPLVEAILTDPDGTPRIQESLQYDNSGQIGAIGKYRFRSSASSGWQDLSTVDLRNDNGEQPLEIDSSTNEVYLLRKKDGRKALYKRKLEANAPLVEVASDSNYDIDGVIKLQHDGPVVGYFYIADRPQTVYFDQSYNQMIRDLGKVLPDEEIGIAAASRDGNTFLIGVSSVQDAGAYYLYNRQAKSLDFVLERQEALANVPLSPAKRVDVPTADGHMIPAYVTMPAGHAANGPAIVLPHGGPSDRDALGFDWLPQFLASRGYAVIQPNYRGSAGYGDQFQGHNAFKDWKTAISDIGASADYLIKQGIASPSRLAIVGWSYGGYAALQSAVTTPEKYKAVVAIAPVTDLTSLAEDSRDFSTASLDKDFIGRGQNLRDGSPLLHASAIKAPVLLVHGDLDANVKIKHSQRMAKALKSAGDSVDYLEFKGLNHQLDDSDARAQMLSKIGELLDRTIGH